MASSATKVEQPYLTSIDQLHICFLLKALDYTLTGSIPPALMTLCEKEASNCDF